MNNKNLNIKVKGIPLCVIVLLFVNYSFASNTELLSLACNDELNISVGADCEVFVEPDMILEGGGPYDPAKFVISVETEGGTEVSNPIIMDVTNGHSQTYIVTITEMATNNSCWTILNLEDKLDPVADCACPPGAWMTDPACQITCPLIDRYLNGTRGAPDIIENCGNVDAVFDGASFVELECGILLVTQNWHVVQEGYPNDVHFYNSTCTNEFYFYQPGLDEVDCPDTEEFSCEEFGELGLTHPDNTGYPEIDGVELVGEINPNCNISAGWSDQMVSACQDDCTNNEKIVRTWTIIDWCAAETDDCIQIIKTVDNEAPTVTANDMLVSTGPWQCGADVVIPQPLLHDNCDYQPNWYIASNSCGALITDVNGNQGGNLPKIRLQGVPKGICEVTLAAVDCCGNIGYDTIMLEVKDFTPPTIVSTQNIIVSLTSSGDDWDGTAKLGVESIDNGSHDNCSPVVLMELRREVDACDIIGNDTYSDKIPENCDPWYDNDDHDYGQYVKFCCNDLTQFDSLSNTAFGIVKVWIRVWDDANMDGIYGSYNFVDLPGNEHDYCEILDNYNELWINVRVEDKAPISLICPPDITIPCSWDDDDLSITGVAIASGTCDHPTTDYVDWPNVHCGEGTILREWSVPGSDYVCVQRITVEPEESELTVVCPTYEDFEDISGNPDISWFDPLNLNHLTVTCEDFEFPEPWVSGGECSLLGISERVDTFWFEQDACFKAIKTYDIVDWCSGQETSCEFVVSVLDDEGPILMCRDTCFGVDDYWDDDNDGLICELVNDVEVEMTAQDLGDCPSEWIKWVVLVDLWSDGTADLEYSSFLPHSDQYYIEPSQTNGKAILELDKDDISAPWAIHRLEWKGFDGCGNVSQCVQFVEVTDKKAPTPYCVNTSTALMEGDDEPILELWAKDFDLGSFDNCDDEENLGYYLFDIKPIEELIGEVHCFKPVLRNNIPCVPDTVMIDGVVHIKVEEVPNCNGYENGFFDVNCITDAIQKWDPAYLDQNGETHKTTSIKLKGTHWCGQNSINVGVFDQKFNDAYCIVELTVHGQECDGGVTDSGEVLGTVNTSHGFWLEDAVLSIQNEGGNLVQTLSGQNGYAFMNLPAFNYYQVKATKDGDDFNGLSTYDVLLVNRHVLQVESFNEVENFIAADINRDEKITAIDIIELRKMIFGIYEEFPLCDSWEILPVAEIPLLSNPYDYQGGQVIEYLTPDSYTQDFRAIKIGDLNQSAFPNFDSENTELRSSSSNILMYHFEPGEGLQFYFDETVDVFHGIQFEIELTDMDFQLRNGVLDILDGYSHIDGNTVIISYNGDEAVTLDANSILFTIDSDQGIQLSQNQSRLKSEFYHGINLNIQDLEIRKSELNNQITLYQNRPNPFDQMTFIEFYLPNEMDVQLSFRDVNGRLLHVVDQAFERGINKVTIDRNAISQTGVILYELTAKDFKDSKKMILID